MITQISMESEKLFHYITIKQLLRRPFPYLYNAYHNIISTERKHKRY